jgi:antitoxin MazE
MHGGKGRVGERVGWTYDALFGRFSGGGLRSGLPVRNPFWIRWLRLGDRADHIWAAGLSGDEGFCNSARFEKQRARHPVTVVVAGWWAKIYNCNVYLCFSGGLVQVSKWGNSLAVRLPTAVVEALELKEGDQIEIRIAGERVFEVGRDPSRAQALARLRKLRRPLPAGFVFDREEANGR